MRVICFVFLIAACACTAGKKNPIDYFGQSPKGPDAEVFAPGIITTDANEHSAVAFSPDGSVVLWAVMDKNYRGRMFEMTFSNGSWSKPTTPAFADTIADYYAPTFSTDGSKLLFNSRRKAEGYREGRGNRIWTVERTQAGWGTPTPFDSTVSKGEEFAHTIASSGTLYYSSAAGSMGTSLNILTAANNNGKYSEPVMLPFNINTVQYEDGPYISPDEDYLIFESTRPEGISGSHDLYISFKSEQGEWCLPLNMGPRVNSAGMERFPRVTPDGKYLLFASNRDQSATRVGFDIYWIEAKVIDELREANKTWKVIEQWPGEEILVAIHGADSTKLEESLRQWLAMNPGNLDGLMLYSTVLRKQKRYNESEQLLEANASSAGKNTTIIIETAFVKYGLDKNSEAEQVLAPVFAESTDPAQRYLEISGPLYEMGRFDISDQYFEKAMAIAPSGLQYYNRACGYAHHGDTRRVFEFLNKAADNGYSSKQQYENDTDLAGVRSDSRYKKLLGKLK
jgi:hypothetical protein